MEAARPEGEVETEHLSQAAEPIPEAEPAASEEPPKGGSGQMGLDTNQPDTVHSENPPPEIR
jgi:hypothetical protein